LRLFHYRSNLSFQLSDRQIGLLFQVQ
jgi:hypothetical protein